MTCTVPINIVRQKTDVCFLKCKLWYKYGNSSCLVTNKQDQVSIVYDGQSDIMFNSVPYTPTEIKIFKPSIHTYDGEYAEAELLIMHSGGQNGLAICIPITLSNNRTYSKGTDLLEEIINNIPEPNQTTTINISDFNANNLVPQSSYFSYAGPIIGGNSTTGYSCDTSTNVQYVVFHHRHGSISLTKDVLDTLGSHINDSFIPIFDGQSFFNEKGTTANGFAGEGQIYIDCQPTNESEDIVYQEPMKPQTMDWLWPFLLIITGILVSVALLRSFNFVWKIFTLDTDTLKPIKATVRLSSVN